MNREEREDINPRNTKRLKLTPPRSSVNVLDVIEKSMKQTQKIMAQQPTKPIVVQKPDPNYVDSLVSMMLRAHGMENIHVDDEESSGFHPSGSPGSTKMELEVRIGIKRDNQFIPGIRKEDFIAYKALLRADRDVVETHSQQVVYNYSVCEFGQIRIVYDEENQKCLSQDLKQRRDNDEMELFCIPYACRYSISSEQEQIPPSTLPPAYKLVSTKTGTRFKRTTDLGLGKLNLLKSSQRLRTTANL